ncbi:sugar transporter SWEET1 [Anabrus simplex]|uniref:sugar transporter SWEET1 n=1 Tax=Anabrus simplex TaxID=316456 RepID=UPI0034DD0570
MPLEDYKDIVATSASVTTILQFFSGAFICKDIIKQGSTKDVSVMPFLGGTAVGVLMLKYSLILDDPAMTRVNLFGLFLNALYLVCYYIYTHEKGAVLTQLMYSTAFVGVLLGYTAWESPDLIEFRFGMIITILLMLLIASPLFSLGEVIRTKSTATLPFPLILSGTLVTFQWLLYGIIIKNEFIQFQNVVGLVLSVIQLSLFAIYPSKPAQDTKKKN